MSKDEVQRFEPFVALLEVAWNVFQGTMGDEISENDAFNVFKLEDKPLTI